MPPPHGSTGSAVDGDELEGGWIKVLHSD
jgi:hypothetical protein